MAMLRLLCMSITLSFALVFCKTVAVQTPSKKMDPIEGLVFLTFGMHQDSVSGRAVELIGKTIVHQKLKSDPQNSTASNRVWISQIARSGNKLASVALDHPLFRRVEFANDQGYFQSKEITLKDAEFFARVTLFAQTEYILVEEELSGKIVYSVNFKLRD
jgi:hypothetical protein